ncbi:Golgi reassembly-stacking protein 2 [Frankliniella fusca]|uniref:Golgi reassembly-stacking protein 2 n=1 Tax=Frankliniella fusca TaxID=407009 RepID=A0AAE1H914_9NEOP|nr:Golgi reassembly-stacking protein 2 [Frankliniella fusca]
MEKCEEFEEVFVFKLKYGESEYNLTVRDKDLAAKMHKDSNFASLLGKNRLNVRGPVEEEAAAANSVTIVETVAPGGDPTTLEAEPRAPPYDSCKLKIMNLPERGPFMESYFIQILEKARRKLVFPKLKSTIVGCTYNKASKSAVVERGDNLDEMDMQSPLKNPFGEHQSVHKENDRKSSIVPTMSNQCLEESVPDYEFKSTCDMDSQCIGENRSMEHHNLNELKDDCLPYEKTMLGFKIPLMDQNRNINTQVGYDNHSILSGTFSTFNNNIQSSSTPFHIDLEEMEDFTSPQRKKDTKVTPKKSLFPERGTVPKSNARRNLGFPSSNLTNKILVSGLPESFIRLNTALATVGFCDESEEPAKDVVECSDTTAMVEESITQNNTCGISFNKEAGKTNRILISDLPKDFNKSILLDRKNRTLASIGFCDESEEPAKDIVDCSDTTATVEFTSVAAATTLCSKCAPFKYKTAVTKLLQNEETLAKVPEVVRSNKIMFSGLPDNFEEAVLLDRLNAALVEQGFCEDKDEPAERVVASTSNSATVDFKSVTAASDALMLIGFKYKKSYPELLEIKETKVDRQPPRVLVSGLPIGFLDFTSVEAVQELCVSCSAHYRYNTLNLKAIITGDQDQVNSYTTTDFDSCNNTSSSLKDSCVVIFYIVTNGYKEDSFKSLILNTMLDCYPELSDSLEIERCKYLKSQKAVEVEFTSCEFANLATLGCSDDIDGEVSELTQTKTMTLTDDEGLHTYLKLLVKHRNDFPKHGSHDETLKMLLPKLAKKGVCATVSELRVKKTRLREKFNIYKRMNRKDKELFLPLNVIFGNGDVTKLEGTRWQCSDEESEQEDEVDEDDERTKKLIQLNDSRSWTIPGTKKLLGVLFDNRDELIEHLYNSRIWRKISLELGRNRFYHSSGRCQKRWEKLETDCNKYSADAGRAAHLDYVLGAGVESVEKRGNSGARMRPTVLKGKMSRREKEEARAERNVAAKEVQAKAMLVVAELLKKS